MLRPSSTYWMRRREQEHSILRYADELRKSDIYFYKIDAKNDAVQLAVELMEDTQASSSRRRC